MSGKKQKEGSFYWRTRPRVLNSGQVVIALEVMTDGENWRSPTEAEIPLLLGKDENPYGSTMGCAWASVGVLARGGMTDDEEEDPVRHLPGKGDL